MQLTRFTLLCRAVRMQHITGGAITENKDVDMYGGWASLP